MGDRVFDTELSADPVAWVADALRDLDRHVPGQIGPQERAEVARMIPAIRRQLEEMLAAVGAGDLAPAPPGPLSPPLRVGWLLR